MNMKGEGVFREGGSFRERYNSFRKLYFEHVARISSE